jgi:hypothetical protein
VEWLPVLGFEFPTGFQSIFSYVSELQRDWARPTADDVAKLFAEHGGGFGQGLRWEWQLLALKEGTR